MLVDLAVDFHQTGLVKGDARAGFIFAKAPEIETTRLRVGEHIVKLLVHVWKLGTGTRLQRNHRRAELITALLDAHELTCACLRIHHACFFHPHDGRRGILTLNRLHRLRLVARLNRRRSLRIEHDDTRHTSLRQSETATGENEEADQREAWHGPNEAGKPLLAKLGVQKGTC